MAREREARADGEAGDDEARHDDEPDDAHGPPEADERDEVLQEDREDDPDDPPCDLLILAQIEWNRIRMPLRRQKPRRAFRRDGP